MRNAFKENLLRKAEKIGLRETEKSVENSQTASLENCFKIFLLKIDLDNKYHIGRDGYVRCYSNSQ